MTPADTKDDSPWLPLGTLVVWLGLLGIGSFSFVAPRLTELISSPPVKPLSPPSRIELKLEPPPSPTKTASAPSAPTEASATPSSLPLFRPSPAVSTLPPLPALAAPALLSLKARPLITPPGPVTPQPVQQTPKIATAAKASGPIVLKPGVGDGVQVMPRYPRLARQRGQEGKIQADIDVDKNGKVTDVRLSSPCPWELLNREVLRVVRDEWRFAPGDERRYTMTFQFLLIGEKKP